MIDRPRFALARVRVGAACILLAAAAGGCTASVPTPAATATAPAPSATATSSGTAAPTPLPTEASGATDTPAATASPEPTLSPLPTVAGRLLQWASVPIPRGLAVSVGSTFQNSLFGWSGGYLAFHEDVLSGSAVPWTSTDAIHWQQGKPLDKTGLGDAAEVQEVVEGPAGLLALGRPGGCAEDGLGCIPQPATALWISTDGLLWTRLDLRKAFGGGAVGDLSAGLKGYMAVSPSSDSGTSQPEVWLSTDGREWRAAVLPSAAFTDAYLARAAVVEGGYLVAGRMGSLEGWGGGGFPVTTPAIWWSADGSTWSRVTLANVAAAPQAEAAIATVAPGRFVAHVVRWDCSCPPEGVTQAWTSSDGGSWKAASRQFPSPAVVMTDGSQALQVVPADGVLTVATSSDGLEWARIPVSGSGPTDLADEAYGSAGLLVEDFDANLWVAAAV